MACPDEGVLPRFHVPVVRLFPVDVLRALHQQIGSALVGVSIIPSLQDVLDAAAFRNSTEPGIHQQGVRSYATCCQPSSPTLPFIVLEHQLTERANTDA